MICPNCKAVFPDTDKFCSQCGTKLVKELQEPDPYQYTIVLEPFFLDDLEPDVPAEPDTAAPVVTEPDSPAPVVTEPDPPKPAAKPVYEEKTPEKTSYDEIVPGGTRVFDRFPVPEEPAFEPTGEPAGQEEAVPLFYEPETPADNEYSDDHGTSKSAFEPDDFLSEYLDNGEKEAEPVSYGLEPSYTQEHLKIYETEETHEPEEITPKEERHPIFGLLRGLHEEEADDGGDGGFSFRDFIFEKRRPILIAAAAVLAVVLIVMGINLITKDKTPDVQPETDTAAEETDVNEESSEASEEAAEDSTAEHIPMKDLKIKSKGLKITAYDINYSQASDIDGSGVDFLIKINNTTDTPVKAVNFRYYQNDKEVRNTLDDSNTFRAYGYVGSHSTGYMYCRMHVPSNTAKNRGKIKLKGAYSANDITDYEIPSGSLGDRHMDGKKDYYDVTITNNNSISVSTESKIITVLEGRDSANYPLADAWGCGDLDDEIVANDTVSLTDAIENPGMSHYGEGNSPVVFVIDREALGIE